MLLSEKIIQRRYNALANDWTPLSRKPCWLSNAFHRVCDYVKRNSSCWFHWLVLSLKITPTNHKLNHACDKSFADDLVESGYCKCESSLCATIHWGFCRVFRFVLPWLWYIIIWVWLISNHALNLGRNLIDHNFQIGFLICEMSDDLVPRNFRLVSVIRSTLSTAGGTSENFL